uniref:Uncharacterized protein n=1 Tax=Trichogramma kaykai TaxID=54128 RepID=A0ABD2WJH6_9HYME
MKTRGKIARVTSNDYDDNDEASPLLICPQLLVKLRIINRVCGVVAARMTDFRGKHNTQTTRVLYASIVCVCLHSLDFRTQL